MKLLKKLVVLVLLVLVTTGCVGNATSYKITFRTNGGNEIDATEHKLGSEIEFPTPTKYGLTFDGWYSDANLESENEVLVMDEEDMTLYAKWEQSQSVNYYLTDGETSELKRTVSVAMTQNARRNAYLSVDGGRTLRMNMGDVATIKKSNLCTKLVRLKDRSFFDVVNMKFRIG